MQIGGDSDTLTSINGAIAEAYYKEIPQKIKETALSKLDDSLLRIVNQFTDKLKSEGKI